MNLLVSVGSFIIFRSHHRCNIGLNLWLGHLRFVSKSKLTNFILFTLIEPTVLLGTLKALEKIVYQCLDLCLATSLLQRSTESSWSSWFGVCCDTKEESSSFMSQQTQQSRQQQLLEILDSIYWKSSGSGDKWGAVNHLLVGHDDILI